MKTKISMLLVFTFVFAGLLSMAVSAQDVDKLKYPKLHNLTIPKVEKITLDNGMRLYLLPDRSLPVFDASVRVNCGSFLEPADKVGLADLCGTVMRSGGTKKWTGDEIDEQLEAVGGSVETSIGLQSGSARVNILSDYTDLGLDVLSQVLRYPVFDQDKIDLAKVRERTSISRRNDDPQQITIREFKKVIYGPESVYARIPEYSTISEITRDDLVKFHDAYYHPQNIQIAFWGDFDRDSLLAEVDKYFGDWKKEGDPVPDLPKVDYKFGSNKVYYIDKEDVNQTNILLGHIGGLVTDSDYADRIVMNNILGGGFGSRLFNTVRSKEGLAYSAYGVYTANIKYPGIFYGFASTKSETTVKAIKAIISEIKRMQVDAPTADEMRMGKDGYLNSFVFNFDTKAEIVNRMMNYDFNGLPEDFLIQTKDGVEKVTSGDVLAAAQRNLRPDDLDIVVVGKGSDFEMPLDQAGLGPVTTVDITIPSAEQKTEVSVTPENLKKGQALLTKAV
ncbi:MAG TPA: pitrilysin family protein, partial [candidate division Zixibacteria bacterium]|nr:pitrilysin family protein [candidate division Zixibacteria bacterium]